MFAERFRFGFLRSLVRLTFRMDVPEDPWQCVELDAPARVLGAGSIHDFPWYFEGESTVAAASFEDVCSFLLGCTYMRDPDLFRVGDFWQHPITFEDLRKGDCEDHALWAWRKLRELGYRAHLVAGSSNRDEVDPVGHVWVIFHADGGLYLLEATAKSRDAMVKPLDALRHHYQPHFSVDETFTMFLYGGFGQYVMNRRSARRQPRPPEPS